MLAGSSAGVWLPLYFRWLPTHSFCVYRKDYMLIIPREREVGLVLVVDKGARAEKGLHTEKLL